VDVLSGIERILAAVDPAEYLSAQDAALEGLALEYAPLWHIALTHNSPQVRQEALQLVSLAHADGHRELLERAFAEDSDPDVRECAKALVFRSVLRDNVVASGKLSSDKFAQYVRDVREGAARAAFAARE
jgi:hypothetical protein